MNWCHCCSRLAWWHSPTVIDSHEDGHHRQWRDMGRAVRHLSRDITPTHPVNSTQNGDTDLGRTVPTLSTRMMCPRDFSHSGMDSVPRYAERIFTSGPKHGRANRGVSGLTKEKHRCSHRPALHHRGHLSRETRGADLSQCCSWSATHASSSSTRTKEDRLRH